MIKFLHTRIRVSDLDQSVAFYQKLGFEPGERKDSPQGNKLAFLHLPGNEHFLELTYSPDYKLAVPEDLMHTCVGVPDIIAYCDQLANDGIEIWPDGWRGKFSSGERKMAFVTDPDGYEVEILER
jgi:lactoylglutathione lyase